MALAAYQVRDNKLAFQNKKVTPGDRFPAEALVFCLAHQERD